MIKFHLEPEIPPPGILIEHHHKIMLVGSCFTEHIGGALLKSKFPVLQNPNGILFDPLSVASSLISYTRSATVDANDLYKLNEIWHSWDHHSRFSGLSAEEVIKNINASYIKASDFLLHADWLIITLGTAYSYQLIKDNRAVANCHRAPANWFNKHLLTIEEINTALDGCLHQLKVFNPSLKIIFTVSPVRHVRDGLINNNRSKACLIESVHHLVNKFDNLYYFPAYELVIDVLRDHRFYDADMVHPNYQATNYVLEQFANTYFSPAAIKLAEEFRKLEIAFRHKPFHPDSEAHQQFLKEQLSRAMELKKTYPYIDLDAELDYFNH